MAGGHCPPTAADGAVAGGGVGLSRRAWTEAAARRIVARRRRRRTWVDVTDTGAHVEGVIQKGITT
jgi:hypothetical protein